MKITKIDIMLVHPDFRTGEVTNMQAIFGKCRPNFVRIHTDEGLYGDGEAGLQFAFGALAAVGMLQDFSHLLIGMDPLKNEQIWDKLYRQGYFTQAGGPVVYAAVSALDMAIWDIKGKYFNTSIATLLGGSRRDKIRAYASQLQFGWGPDKTPATRTEQYAENARIAIEDGFSAVKFDFFTFDKDGRSFNENERTKLLSPYYVGLVEERVAAVREAIGPDKDLIVEGHSFTDAASAIQIGEAIRKHNIFYYEEACTPNPKLQKFVYDALKIPMSSGERIFSRWQYMPYLENQSLQVLQPDLSNCGGITEAKKIADMAYIYDVSIQGHLCGSALSMSATLQFESVIPNFLIHEHHVEQFQPYMNDLCTVNYAPDHGWFDVPQGPGLGTEISEYALTHCDKWTIDS